MFNRLLSAMLVITYLTSCYVWRSTTVSPQETLQVEPRDRVRVTQVDRTRIVVYGPSIANDTLRGFSDSKPHDPLDDIPLAQVVELEVRESSFVLTTTLVVGVILGVGLGLIALAVCTSC